MQKVNKEIWKKDIDGTMILLETIQIEIEVPTQEEIIAEKEAELIAIYNEIQNLKKEQ